MSVINRLQALLGNIAVIRPAKGSDLSGFALIIGAKGDRLHLVTPLHNIVSEGNRLGVKTPRDSVISLRGSGESLAARVEYSMDDGTDLAFISVSNKGFLNWQEPILANDVPAPATKVWLMGKLAKWDISASPGVVSRYNADTGELAVDGLDGWGGSSGGAVFSEIGLVGIYLGAGRGMGEGRVLSIHRIREINSSSTINKPWLLSTSVWDRSPVPVQIARSDNLPFKIEVLDSTTGRRFGVPAKLLLSPGNYSVVYDPSLSVCDPEYIPVRRMETNSIAIRCSYRLYGNWAVASHELSIVEAGDGNYDFGGFVSTKTSERMPVKGRLLRSNTDGDRWMLAGNDALGRIVQGNIVVINLEEMRSSFYVGPDRIEVVFKRH